MRSDLFDDLFDDSDSESNESVDANKKAKRPKPKSNGKRKSKTKPIRERKSKSDSAGVDFQEESDDSDPFVITNENSESAGNDEIFRIENSVGSDSDQVDVDDILQIGQLGDPGSADSGTTESSEPLEIGTPADPFKYDENKSLRVEGISSEIKLPDAFYFKCPVCESELQATDQQIDQKVRCEDCHSNVVVVKPKHNKKMDVWRKAATLRVTEDSVDDLKLEEPVSRPAVDYSADPTLGLSEVSEDLLAPRMARDEADPNESVEARRTSIGPSGQNLNQNEVHSKPQRESKPASPQQAQVRDRKSKLGKRNGQEPESMASRASAGKTSKPISIFQAFDLKLATDMELVIRSVVAIVFLTFCYAMVDSVAATLAREDLAGGEKFVAYFPAAVGAFVCFFVVCWFVTVNFSVLMRAIANGQSHVEEWVGFAPSEWMGSFIVVAVSMWAALLPGMLGGYFFWRLTGWFVFMPLFGAISAFSLAPILLISSFYNESAFNMFSDTIIGTLTKQQAKWTAAYQQFAIVLAIFVGGLLVVFIPSLLFAFLGATIQIGAVIMFAVLLGLHAKTVIDGIHD